jgi:hypothetical protein
VSYAERYYYERRYAERRYAERRYAERRYAERRYAERRYAECRGVTLTSNSNTAITLKFYLCGRVLILLKLP